MLLHFHPHHLAPATPMSSPLLASLSKTEAESHPANSPTRHSQQSHSNTSGGGAPPSSLALTIQPFFPLHPSQPQRPIFFLPSLQHLRTSSVFRPRMHSRIPSTLQNTTASPNTVLTSPSTAYRSSRMGPSPARMGAAHRLSGAQGLPAASRMAWILSCKLEKMPTSPRKRHGRLGRRRRLVMIQSATAEFCGPFALGPLRAAPHALLLLRDRGHVLLPRTFTHAIVLPRTHPRTPFFPNPSNVSVPWNPPLESLQEETEDDGEMDEFDEGPDVLLILDGSKAAYNSMGMDMAIATYLILMAHILLSALALTYAVWAVIYHTSRRSAMRTLPLPPGAEWIWGHERFVYMNPPGVAFRNWINLVGTAFRIKAAFGAPDIVMNDLVSLVQKEGDRARVNTIDWTGKATVSIVGRLTFLHDFEVGNNAEARNILIARKRGVSGVVQYAGFLSGVAYEMIRRNQDLVGVGQEKERKDLLSRLCATRYCEERISLNELYEQISTFIVAGFESTTTTLGFTIWELARQPDAQRRLREELATISGEPTYDDFQPRRKGTLNMWHLWRNKIWH
ncbi:hypothetical protein EW146_g3914 [Bondarzewia mesenterica]|uniref:Cytochrome P450 n=1 Tax=Bondarzewia mesenterica TaxID=1095465 RepID=A0A4S4LWB7_9AGAM|nr:hypothetical protein EW146_g3914 [Bondarzewia mesenterica]